jgi:hypothetical protein
VTCILVVLGGYQTGTPPQSSGTLIKSNTDAANTMMLRHVERHKALLILMLSCGRSCKYGLPDG